jgi:hypothetical protein
MMTDSEILVEIDRLIQTRYHRWKHTPDDPQHRSYLALKEVAIQLRASDRAGETIAAMENKLRGLERSRDATGNFDRTHLREVALEVRAKWSVIRQALLFFEDARKVDAQ